MSYFKYPPETPGNSTIPISQWALFVRDVKIYNVSRTLLVSDISTFWDTTVSELTVTLFPAGNALYDNTFHRYRIVNGGTHILHVVSPTLFWNDGIQTLTIKPRHAITVSAVRVGATIFWTVIEDTELSYATGTASASTIAGAPINLNIGAMTSDLSEGTITQDATHIIVGPTASGDYKFTGSGTVVDTGSSSIKIGYLTLRIDRGGTILSRSSFSILTRGGGNTYTWFIPQQTVSLLANDKVYFEFEPNTIASGTVRFLDLSMTRIIQGV